MKPRLSVIIPVYNTGMLVCDAVKSVASQTLQELEIIIVNDGSTDGSDRIISRLADEDKRIRVVTQQNMGLSEARNSGIREAKADLIGFLDSDDEYGDPQMLAEYVSIMETDPELDFVEFPHVWYYPDGRNIPINLKPYTLTGQDIIKGLHTMGIWCSCWNKIWRKRQFCSNRFSCGKYFEDEIFMADVCADLKKITYSPLGHYKYKIRNGSITQSKWNLKKHQDRVECKIKWYSSISRKVPFDAGVVGAYSSALDALGKGVDEFGLEPFVGSATALRVLGKDFSIKQMSACGINARRIAKIMSLTKLGAATYFILRKLINKK